MSGFLSNDACMGMDIMATGSGHFQAAQGLQMPLDMPPGVSSAAMMAPQVVWAHQEPGMHGSAAHLVAGGSYQDQFLMHQPQLHQMMVQTPPQQQAQQLTTIFFAGVTPIVDTQQLLGVFAQFGRVMDLNLFRPYKGCRTSKGCGLVVFSQHSEAAAALETLNGRFVWPGARSPMVIEWCDPSKQHKRKRAQPLAPALLQQVLVCQQQQVAPCMQAVIPATSISLGFMPHGNAGRLVMPGY